MAEKETQVKEVKALPDPLELVKEAWAMNQKRFWSIVGVYLLSILYFLGYFLIFGVIAFILSLVFKDHWNIFSYSIMGILVLIFLLGLMWLGSWVGATYLVILRDWNKEGTGVRSGFKKARPFIIPFLLTVLLTHVLIFGVSFLLVIPAIVFGVWFSFATYTVVCENKKGLLALHTSREYIRGRFWGVVGRELVVHLPEILLNIAVIILIAFKVLPRETNTLLQFISLLLTPFYMMFSYVLYTHARKMSESPASVPSGSKRVYLLLPLFGVLLAIIIGTMVFPKIVEQVKKLPLTNESMSSKRDTSSAGQDLGQSVGMIYGQLIRYYVDNNAYPSTLDELEEYADQDLTTQTEGITYKSTENGENFELCIRRVPLQNGICLTKDGPTSLGIE